MRFVMFFIRNREKVVMGKLPVVRSVNRELHLKQELRKERVQYRAAIISQWPPWRQRVHEFVRGAPFERTVFLIIVVNCLAISTQNINSLVAQSSIFSALEAACNVLFLIEMILKLIGLGVLVRRVGYFSSAWNVLDFIITVVSMGALIVSWANESDGIGLAVARSFRLLRPIRFFSVLGSLRLIVRAIGASLIRLGNVFALSVAFLAFMALMALQFFQDAYSYRCLDLVVLNLTSNVSTAGSVVTSGDSLGALESAASATGFFEDLALAFVGNGDQSPCCTHSSNIVLDPLLLNLSASLMNVSVLSLMSSSSLANSGFFSPVQILRRSSSLFYLGQLGGMVVDRASLPYTSDEIICPSGQFCLPAQSPGNGEANFADVLGTVVLLYTIVSLDGWSSMMFYVMDSKGYQVPIYFSVLVIIGTIFILNLALAIISDSFGRQVEFENAFLKKQKRIEGRSGLFVQPDEILGAASMVMDDGVTNTDALDSTRRSSQCQALPSPPAPVSRAASARDGGWTGMLMTPGLLQLATPPPRTWNDRLNWICKLAVQHVFSSIWYEAGLNIAAMCNGIALASAHAAMSTSQVQALRIINSVFTLVFALDFLLHAFAAGVRNYFLSPLTQTSHVFDAIVAVGSVVEYFMSGGESTAIGSLRLLRLSTWFRFFPSIQSSVDRLFKSVRSTVSLVLFTVIVLYMFALLGMVAFGGKMCHLDATSPDRVTTSVCADVPRSNFDNIGYSLVTVFIIMAGDGWRNIMTNGMQGTNNPYSSIYFCLCYLITGYLVLNIFIAILIANFATRDDDDDDEGASVGPRVNEDARGRHEQSIVLSTTKSLFALKSKSTAGNRTSDNFKRKGRKTQQDDAERKDIGVDGNFRDRSNSMVSLGRPLLVIDDDDDANKKKSSSVHNPPAALHIDYSLLDSNGHLPSLEAELVSLDSSSSSLAGVDRYTNKKRREKHLGNDDSTSSGGDDDDDEDSLDSEEILRSFDIVHTKSDVGASIAERRKQVLDRIKFEEGRKSAPRFIAGSIVKSRKFKALYLLVLLYSNVTLIAFIPTDFPDSRLALFEKVSDVILAVLFLVEACLKILYLGLYHPKGVVLKGYFNYRWNIFDFVLMVFAVCSVASLGAAGHPWLQEAVQWFRVTRCLRPLSLLGTNETLALVFRAMIASLPRIRNVGVVILLVWFTYSVLGLQLFSGRYNACSSSQENWGDQSYGGPYIKTMEACLNASFLWIPADRNFDSLGNALVTMFQVATTDNWDTIMYTGIDSVDSVTAPIPRHRSFLYVYFMSFVVIVSYFLLNVFVSVMVDAYFLTKSRMEEQRRHTLLHHHEATLDSTQMDFFSMYRRALYFVKPPLRGLEIVPGSLRFILRKVLRVHYFEAVYVVCVALHVVLLATTYMTSPPFDYTTLMIIDIFFNTIFVAISVLRIVVVGWVGYFSSTRNRWEFAINIITSVSLAVRLAVEGSGNYMVVNALRNVRIFRLYRVVYMSTSMRLLVATVFHSAPKFLVVAYFVLEIFFIYAVVGMKLFGRVKFRDNVSRAYIGRYANFERFDAALICLLRVATLDDWTELMYSSAVSEPDCSRDAGDCGIPGLAQIYFMSFVLFGQWLGINFFTAEVMDAFSSSEREERYVIQRADVVRFQQLWKSLANPKDGLMSLTNLQRFVVKLGPPIGPAFLSSSSLFGGSAAAGATASSSSFFTATAGGTGGSAPVVDAQLIRSFLASLDVLTVDNCVTQGDIFDALVRDAYGLTLPIVFDNELRALVVSRFQQQDTERERRRQQHQHQQQQQGIAGGNSKLCEAVSALIIQSRWRGAKIRRVVRSAMAASATTTHTNAVNRDHAEVLERISFAFSPIVGAAVTAPSVAGESRRRKGTHRRNFEEGSQTGGLSLPIRTPRDASLASGPSGFALESVSGGFAVLDHEERERVKRRYREKSVASPTTRKNLNELL